MYFPDQRPLNNPVLTSLIPALQFINSSNSQNSLHTLQSDKNYPSSYLNNYVFKKK
jgi:hypothetical protein